MPGESGLVFSQSGLSQSVHPGVFAKQYLAEAWPEAVSYTLLEKHLQGIAISQGEEVALCFLF